MKTARQFDAERVQTIQRMARLWATLYHATLASGAAILIFCAIAQLGWA